MTCEKNCPLADASWIGGDEQAVSPVILRRFYGKDIKKATLFVTGLGFFEARINDLAVSDDRFVPVVSDYGPRPLENFGYPLHDEVTHRVYYCRYDVTSMLREGENTLSIQLGNGWYRQKERICEGDVSFGETLKAIYSIALETASGSEMICSDGSETWRESEIIYNNLFIGEVVDPTAVGDEKPVALQPAPEAELSEQIGTPDKIIRCITPKLMGTVDGRNVYDVGESISGVVQIHTSAAKGEKIRLRFAEEVGDDLTLDFRSAGSDCICGSQKPQIMEDIFISDGTPRTYEPKFVWHAFRYFEVEGSIDEVSVLVIHSDVPVTATFQSSSEGLQFLFDAFIRTQQDNMHGSIPSDCPHRERLGYTGDGQVCAPAVMLMMESKDFYRKWIQDILDCQDHKSGHVQHTAPLMGGGGGPGGWGCAIVLVPFAYYRQFGDVGLLKRCYEPMKHWIDYLLAHSENGLVTHEEEGGWCLGDWCTLEDVVIPEAFVNTCYLLKCLRLLTEIAVITGNDADVTDIAALIKSVSEAILNNYYDAGSGHYCDGVQGADAFAVWAGLAGRECVEQLAETYGALGHFDTGFLATDILMEVLMDYGYADVALQLLESEEPGSFLYMKRHGATTLWENWQGTCSHNHPMFGACVRQLFAGFLGIRQPQQTAGYTTVEIAPRVPQQLKEAKGSICTPKGTIAVAWKRQGDAVSFHIEIPAGVTASFHYKDTSRKLLNGEHEILVHEK